MLFMLCFILLFILSGCSEPVKPAEGTAKISFLDTGQSNATLIQTYNGKNILVDTGLTSTKKKLLAELKGLGVQELDLLVLTHWHADHTGGAQAVLNELPVQEVWVNGTVNTTKLTTNILKKLDESGVKVTVPKAGDSRIFDDLTLTVLGPVQAYKDDQNLSSIVLRLDHGSNAILLPADSETQSLKDIINSGANLSANVYLAAHHGSKDATTEDIVNALGSNLQYVVIEVGTDNDYNLPNDNVLLLFQNRSKPIYRTDQNGTITVVSSPEGIVVTPQRGEAS